MIYFTSDLHFFHANILKYQAKDRPFNSVAEMNFTIAEYWRTTIRPNDELYVLGDICMGHKQKVVDLLRELPGRIHLIRGNHDYFNIALEAELFETVSDYKVVRHNGERIVLFHYPIEEWDRCYYGDIHLHGHSHGNLKNIKPNRFDIGWDVYKRFVPIDEVLSWRVSEHVPHHGIIEPREGYKST